DLDEFVRQYRKAGGQIEVTVFEGEGEGLLRNPSSPVARQALEQMTTFIHRPLGETRSFATAVIGRHGPAAAARGRATEISGYAGAQVPRPDSGEGYDFSLTP